MKKYILILSAVLLFLSAHMANADIGQLDYSKIPADTPQSPNVVGENLGTNLSGTLTSIDMRCSNTGVARAILTTYFVEWNDADLTSFNQLLSNNDGFIECLGATTTITAHFSPFVLNPTKFYEVKGYFNTDPMFYGTANPDGYPNGFYCKNLVQDYTCGFSASSTAVDSVVKDMYFNIPNVLWNGQSYPPAQTFSNNAELFFAYPPPTTTISDNLNNFNRFLMWGITGANTPADSFRANQYRLDLRVFFEDYVSSSTLVISDNQKVFGRDLENGIYIGHLPSVLTTTKVDVYAKLFMGDRNLFNEGLIDPLINPDTIIDQKEIHFTLLAGDPQNPTSSAPYFTSSTNPSAGVSFGSSTAPSQIVSGKSVVSPLVYCGNIPFISGLFLAETASDRISCEAKNFISSLVNDMTKLFDGTIALIKKVFPISIMTHLAGDIQLARERIPTSTDIVFQGSGKAFTVGDKAYAFNILNTTTTGTVSGVLGFDYRKWIDYILYLMTGGIILFMSINFIKGLSGDEGEYN